MTLHLYFARKFALGFAGLFAVFVLMLLLIDVIEQLRRAAGRDISLAQVLELALLNTPQGIYTMLPLIMILSTVALFLGLARSSELVVTRASGRSALVALVAPVCVAALIGVGALAMLNPIVAATTKRFAELDDRYRSGTVSVASISGEGLWLRQGDGAGQTVIRVGSASPDGTVFHDVTFLSYLPGGSPTQRIEAARAELLPDFWDIRDAKVWQLQSDINPEATAETRATMTLPTTLTHDNIRDSFGAPASVSIWDLPRFIAQLQEAGFSAQRHQVWFHMELASPLFLVAMMLIASAFTMRHVRFGKTGIAVLTAVLLGFTLYYIRNFAQILGENGQLPVLLAAWAPPVAAVMLGLGILLHMEDG